MMKVKLGDVCEIVSGTTPKSNCPEYWNGELNWITPAELNDDIVVVNESQRKITTKAVIDSNLRSFPAGTVLLSSRAPIGKVAIAGKEMYCNQGFKNLICSDFIYNKYLFYFLKSKVAYLNSLGRGATFKEISKTIVENIQINLPKKEEQYKIVYILDKIIEIISLRQQQLKKLDELVKSRFIEQIGTIKNTKFKITELENLCEFIKDGTHQTPTYTDDKIHGFKFLSSKDVTTRKISWDKVKYITPELHKQLYSVIAPKRGDILLAKNGTIGYAAVVDNDEVFDIYVSLALLRPKKENDIYYLWAAINNNETKAQFISSLKGIGVPNLHLKEIKKTKIIIPPIDVQREFSCFITQLNKSKLEIQKSLDKLEILKKSLMQQYFG